MRAGGNLEGVRAFVEPVAARLRAEGWRQISADEGRVLTPRVSVGFARAMKDGFVAMAEVEDGSSSTGRLPVVITAVRLGMVYEPLQRLWPLLGRRFRGPVVMEEAELWEDAEWEPIPIRGLSDAARAADRVVELISQAAPRFIQRYGSVDGLVEELSGFPDTLDQRLPAVLAAAGRFAEARKLLDAYPPSSWDLVESEAKAFSYQLRRWIDSGGDPALIPPAIPPREEESEPTPGTGEIWKRAWREARARRDALETVRREREGRARQELRSMLESELERRGLRESPLWYERALDDLAAAPDQRAQLQRDALKSLSRLGLGAVKLIRERTIPDLSIPQWMAAPDGASYRVTAGHPGQWVAVTLDDSARPWLERVHHALPKMLETTMAFDAWIDSSKDRSVYIGKQRVGGLDEDAAVSIAPELDAASRGESVVITEARLTKPRTGYLLELRLPSP